VKQAQVRVFSGGRTAAVVGAGVVGFGGLVYALVGKLSNPRMETYCDAPEHVDEPICVNQ
jgi:hypothetical protein